MNLQNIDPIYFLTPIIVIGFSAGLVVYWHVKRRFTLWVLLLSLLAYAGAIITKEVFQYFTLVPFESAVGGNTAALGIYFGLQTVIFEVGGAFLVAWYAFSHGKIKANDAEGYGIGLAFWENAVLIGGFSLLLPYIIYYATLSGGGSAAQLLFSSLSNAAPVLFYSPSSALPIIGFSILERVSSLLVHFSWGFLCVLAVAYRKKLFLWLALPMGFIDFLVPYASILGVQVFETLIFGLSLLCLLVALGFTKMTRKNVLPTSSSIEGSSRSKSLFRTNFKRAISYGAVYLGTGLVISILFGGIFSSIASVGGSVPLAILEEFPLMLPMFVVIGCLGGLMIFVSDRSKGVYEYLIAYGVSTYEIFWSTVQVTLGLVTIILASSIAANMVMSLLIGGSIQPVMIELLLIYTIPLSYAGAAFMSMASMLWSSLTVRMVGVNSPVGLAPILGIVPVLAVYFLALFDSSDFLLITVGATLILVALVIVMMVVANKKMSRERLLSDA